MAGLYANRSRVVLGDVEDIGGAPSFCQEDWDYLPKNPRSKTPFIPLLSIGAGQQTMSDILNDSDAGTINVYAAPGDFFGTVSFSCHGARRRCQSSTSCQWPCL